jgi:hypothetical protein
MPALSISIATLALAAGLATPLSAQTAAGPDAPKRALTPMKVQSPHPSPKRIAAAGQAGKQAAAGKHLTAGYQENDINAAPFGSQHWWRVQGWQAGGSSSQP